MTADPVGILNAEAGSEHLGTWAAAPVAMARQTSARNILAKVWQARAEGKKGTTTPAGKKSPITYV